MDILALVTRLCSIDPSINEHIRIAKMRPKGRSCSSSARKANRGYLHSSCSLCSSPVVDSEPSCANFKAGNLKNMKMYMAPSKTPDVRLRERIRGSKPIISKYSAIVVLRIIAAPCRTSFQNRLGGASCCSNTPPIPVSFPR